MHASPSVLLTFSCANTFFYTHPPAPLCPLYHRYVTSTTTMLTVSFSFPHCHVTFYHHCTSVRDPHHSVIHFHSLPATNTTTISTCSTAFSHPSPMKCLGSAATHTPGAPPSSQSVTPVLPQLDQEQRLLLQEPLRQSADPASLTPAVTPTPPRDPSRDQSTMCGVISANLGFTSVTVGPSPAAQPRPPCFLPFAPTPLLRPA